ncbi:telomere-associated recQ-like helicase [Ilyonectria destructans]|nr:telomere-associated recQ-like helicase [Ilyonectria destructans]
METNHQTRHDEPEFCLPSGYWLRLSEALFQLSMMFWTHQDPAGNMSSSVLIYYTAVMGIQRRSLAYNSAHNSTSGLAALIWVGRLLFLEYALPVYSYATLVYKWPSRDQYPSQPDRLSSIRKKYLIRGCYTPFGEIIELKAFAKSIVKREGIPGNLSWAPDGRSFTIGHDRKFKLSEFCETHYNTTMLVQERVNEMIDIQDDLTCRKAGWSFIQNTENKLVDSSSFRGKPFVKNTDWQIETCIAYLDAGMDLSKLAFAASHFSGGLPGRGTEITTIRYINTTLAIRNVFFHRGQMIIIISYNKARASNNHAFYIVRYLPQELSQSLLKYLAIIRPVLGHIAQQLSLPHWSDSEFFFPDPRGKKRHLSSIQASNIIRNLTQDLITPWTLSSYRQAALAIAKRHLSKLVERSNFYYPTEATNPIRMFAAGAGHHPRMLLTAYAIDKALPARLQPELLEMYYRLSTIWQDWNQQYHQQSSRSMEPEACTSKRCKRLAGPDDPTRRLKKVKTSSSSSSTNNHMNDLTDGFIYNAQYRVLICVSCGSMIQPGVKSFYSHLNSIHRITGLACKALIERFQTYELCPFGMLSVPKGKILQIPGLTVYRGWRCNICPERIDKMHDHMPTHKKKASQHNSNTPLWTACRLQTYFTAKGRIDYFVIEGPSPSPSTPISRRGGSTLGLLTPPLSQEEGKLFGELKADISQASRDLDEKAKVVQAIEESRADRVPWLVHTGFPTHLQGLRDVEIQSSYSLPSSKTSNGDGCSKGDAVTDLSRIISAAEATLRDAYRLCSDKSLDRKMTQQRAKRLSEFRDGGSSSAAEATLRDAYRLCSDKSLDRKMTQQRAKRLSEFRDGGSSSGSGGAYSFRSFKNESSLVSYFRRMKQLLAYYYRVIFCEDGHFTRDSKDQILPQDVIEATPQQQQAIDQIIDALRAQDKRAEDQPLPGQEEDAERDAELKHAIRNFYVALVCQSVGSRPFRSVILSFCAMLSRKKAFTRQGSRNREGDDESQGRRCVWYEPGNFNSNLSALTWTAQLILFDFVCFQKQDEEDEIPQLLSTLCRKYLHPMAETPFGHILQWRLYLFAAARTAVAKNQARWSLDGQTVTYIGTELHMEQVSQLAVSEFRQAHSLLYDKLLFGARDIASIEAWRLQDDLDLDDYGGSWLTDERNAEILEGTQDALLRQIEGRADLRWVFVRTDPDGMTYLCSKAIALYEAHVQEFLKRMVTLMAVPPGPPLRSPELLSITYVNTGARRRSLLIWEKLVMVYVQYHKSQEQTGREKDNIRFLPPAIGDLLLTYLALVPPLRQVFLRQRKPGALLSPHLWSKLDGEVWRDLTVSSCLRKACARAEVPQFQEVEDEADLADLAGMSNHSYRTFNHAYAGGTTLAMTALLHRAYRASQSWRTLFQIDQLLQGKRPRTVSETQAQGLLAACKKVRFRTRPVAKEADLIRVARGLYDDPELQLRRPGQRDAMLATLGPKPAEQVIVVLATGSGKTLVFMVAAVLEGAATTILILPTVALCGNMIDRLNGVKLNYHIWSPGSTKSAPLVITSAETACTNGFLEYANRLIDRQRLDRIVVDECHLTITASDYRRSMSQLAWHVRRIRTQTVWMTATLPPTYYELFLEHNKLVRPRVIWESTNRPNIRYIVRRERGPGSLLERATRLVQSCWERTDLFRSERDRVILYCPTKELVAELADMLGCPSYTADSGTADEKGAIIKLWLQTGNSPAIVATAALGPGFDYAHVRWVIHVGAPSQMTDFSQESGRGGRDGKPAESIILLNAAWQPQLDQPLSADSEAMQLYLMQRHCSRGILSQFLDGESDWRWCMEDDELCAVCPEHHRKRRPPSLQFHLPKLIRSSSPEPEEDDDAEARPSASEIVFTGPREVLRQARVCDEELSRYESDLQTMLGCCLYCRVEGKPFEHAVTTCARRHHWIKAKQKALRDCQSRNRDWLERYVVCWNCYQPQEICRAADPDYDGDRSCRFPDMVMPLCFGAFSRPGRTKWFLKHFNQTFKTCHEYMLWLGTTSSLGGSRCAQANRVAALLLAELE